MISFPIPPRPAATGATRWQVLRGRLHQAFRWALHGLRVPGAIRSVQIDDELTGQQLEIASRASTTGAARAAPD